MRKSFVLGSFLAGVMAAGAAPAAVVPVTVSATGTYSGNLAVLNDGVVPANGSNYNAPDKVAFTAFGNAVFRFDFGGLATIDSLLATVDNNDDYQFRFFDGAGALLASVAITGPEGSVGYGVETFTRAFAPVSGAAYALVTASGGDSLYGLGEVQFNGTLAAPGVPEPATWAMLIGGFGVVGGAARRRTARVVAA
ncbi:PEPxxWA-CTERM sorting domain-containing protein [Sphingomonas sp. MAH-20]|uniref:PEPxxWA-CTERM sorting domain-containing protein n=1 Tax=Sphingomonas horti TaxID=2682842 RepID=A0A6I4J2A1_9SPHN|nr:MULTISPECIES: PEPxxWA-CTERM sorting domain-containing protein [Sphingomonas]MBA2918719.1 PEPxxWA-CTERM sorting domain-containing protein [Sphingomonas sp. CGMCC 1.13658]MVO78750.1 PEPxxWA-CTERM sorting domain-containing protein [Sphingomonas horti]